MENRKKESLDIRLKKRGKQIETCGGCHREAPFTNGGESTVTRP